MTPAESIRRDIIARLAELEDAIVGLEYERAFQLRDAFNRLLALLHKLPATPDSARKD